MESEKSEKEASPEALFAGEGLALSPSERVTMETNRSPQLGRGSPSRNPLVSRPAAGRRPSPDLHEDRVGLAGVPGGSFLRRSWRRPARIQESALNIESGRRRPWSAPFI
ncbi:hypothetical protein IscW_ISCW021279 [Ixodes scapularis]|uniref:Uncharacterized protein n=1 Tax=Ixodes scapularis TaxID=6945 RepID=B7Q671_IXOSC|nr:hypothetical protein IscW_ISCW021279 [Ixodes scapularis]|eukprot:XP_002402831.1 hypothetical protein IscW_ISCW021279 [Ixodes scapularis]